MSHVFFSSLLSLSRSFFDWKVTNDIGKDRPRSGLLTSNVHLFMNLCLYTHSKFKWWAMNFIFDSWFAHTKPMHMHTYMVAGQTIYIASTMLIPMMTTCVWLQKFNHSLQSFWNYFHSFLLLFTSHFISGFEVFQHFAELSKSLKFDNKFQIHQIQNYFATISSMQIIHCKYYKNVENELVKSIKHIDIIRITITAVCL